MTGTSSWKDYEEVACHLLNEFGGRFGLGHVEGKQIVPGASGTEWEIDAKASQTEGKGFLVVECRKHTKNISQSQIAALAYTIEDTGADGGIMVTPVDLQSGALLVARCEGIQHIKLSRDSTTSDYLLEFLGNAIHGLSIVETGNLQDSTSCTVVHADGTID
ncbi:MAG TPA: restriction endonuclease [Steroidobacteraceae bacterium]|jgi:hypothetical protein